MIDPGFGLYIHWPFCRSKCPYCDFNSHVADGVDQARWRRALLAELDWWAARVDRRPLTSLFFGGGTPSLMDPETVGAVIERARGLLGFAGIPEITLEANPTSVEADRFAAYRAAGVNRVSLGVQALNAADLAFLGRQHGPEEALAAVSMAARHFPRFSFDLIYARPGQSVAAWRDELGRALGHAGSHLSVYQLTIEPGTQFQTRFQRGEIAIPDNDLAGALYETTQEILDRAGLPAYEISNHARPGEESRHNLTYWRMGPYLGIGPGAHGRVPRGGVWHATRQARAPETWIAAVEADGHGTAEETTQPAGERRREILMMGLRLAEGIPYGRLDVLPSADRRSALVEEGYLVDDGRGIRATAAGRQRLNGVLDYLLA
ncbi:MAG: coproporphyrinogen III oxidase [Alphaproteobacteria bacterium]|nr:coproporphyrinogen III oxidase [Alphaproteobacteria bacterium]